MPADYERTEIQIAWIDFAKSVRVLLVPQTDDRPLDQYLAFRDAVFVVVQGEQFLNDLNSAWEPAPANFKNKLPPDIQKALLLELKAVPLEVEVAQKTGKQEEEKGWWRRVLGRASTVSGSVKDILENLPPYAQNALTLFKELIDLFKGKD